MSKLIAILTAALVMAGCAQRPTTAAAGGSSVSNEVSNQVSNQVSYRSPSARQTCVSVFPHGRILGWRGATLAGLRAYQYGGPIAHRPLKDAYPGLPRGRTGAWCELGRGRSATLWGVVAGERPRRVVSVTGPGLNHVIGRLDVVPQVP